jgi:hypothetical protein
MLSSKKVSKIVLSVEKKKISKHLILMEGYISFWKQKSSRRKDLEVAGATWTKMDTFIMLSIKICSEKTTETVRKPITLDARNSQKWLDAMHKAYTTAPKCQYNDESKFSDEDFQVLAGLRKVYFQQMFEFCKNVQVQNHKVHTKDLLCFLVKMHQGLSDEFLKVYFILKLLIDFFIF